MQLKVFHIRLSKDHFFNDQEVINRFMEAVVIKKTAAELVNDEPRFWSIVVFYEEKNSEAQPKPSTKLSVAEGEELTVDDIQVYETLKRWRQDKANELNLPTFMICHNTELMSLAKFKPKTLEDLSNIKGFGDQKIAKHGQEILMLLAAL